MATTLTTRPGQGLSATVTASRVLTGYTVTVEFASTSSFKTIALAKTPTTAGRQVSFYLTSSEVTNLKDAYFRVVATKDGSAKTVADGRINFIPVENGALTVADVVDSLELKAAFVAAIERTFQRVSDVSLQRFAATVTPAWSDASGWEPRWLTNGGKRVVGAKHDAAGAQIGYSDNDGVTWTTARTFATTQGEGGVVVEALLVLSTGEILVCVRDSAGAYWASVWRSTGWAANPATATWARVNRAPFAALATKVSGDYRGFAYDGTARIMAAWYDRKTAGPGAGGPATSAGVYVRYSPDNGTTWTDVFNLATWLTSKGVDPLAYGYHVHSAAYDPYWDAWWISYGDTDGTSGRCGILHSRDNGATWTSAYEGTAWQSVAMYPMLDRILLSGDGGASSGINVLVRNADGTVQAPIKGYSLGGLNGIGECGWPNPEPGGWVLLPMTQITGTTRVSRLVATADGKTFYDLYIDPDYVVSGVSGLHVAVGPTARGKILGSSSDNRYAGGKSLLTLTGPL